MLRVESSVPLVKPLEALGVRDGKPSREIPKKESLPLILVRCKLKRMPNTPEHILHRVVSSKRTRDRHHDVDSEQLSLLQHLARCETFQECVRDNTDEHNEDGLDKKREA